MKINKVVIATFVLIIISIVGTILVYPNLPQTIPSHWGLNGEVDAYSDKSIVYILGAALPLGMALLFLLIPLIDPKKENYKLHEKAYLYMNLSTILFIVCIHWITLMANFYKEIDVVLFIRLMIGILFIIIGNYMTQIRFNYFMGMRTPWTLADESVWRKTHRLSGYLFSILGSLLIGTYFLAHTIGFVIMIGGIIILTGGTTLYSYLEYKKLSKKQ